MSVIYVPTLDESFILKLFWVFHIVSEQNLRSIHAGNILFLLLVMWITGGNSSTTGASCTKLPTSVCGLKAVLQKLANLASQPAEIKAQRKEISCDRIQQKAEADF